MNELLLVRLNVGSRSKRQYWLKLAITMAAPIDVTDRMEKSNYSERTAQRLRWYLPLASAWVLEQERFILKNGVPLTAAQLADAKLVGVAQPARVRLFRIEQIPLPEHPDLMEMKEAMKLTTPALPGLTLRYGIYIRSDQWGQRRLVVHELTHTAQYERLVSVRAFLECYLYECLAIGYTSAPMEQEAIGMAQRICGPAQPTSMLQTPLPHVPPVKSSTDHRQQRS